MTGSCGRCHAAPAEPGKAWCTDCFDESSPGAYILGRHVSQFDPAEVRGYGCRCPAGALHNNDCPAMAI